MNINHKHYKEIPVQICDNNCPQHGGTILKIILFAEHEKLRSHAVKHFANPLEFDISWKDAVSADEQLIRQCVKELYLLGCPFFEPGSDFKYPRCKHCRYFFHECTDIVVELEKGYLNLIKKILEEGGNIPRYACAFSDSEGASIFWTMPDRAVVAKTVLLQKDIYNLKTCYSRKTRMPLQRMRDIQISKLRGEARPGSIIWCNKNNWGIRNFK
ncbi:hypothetical protein QUF80_11320 [Desulfococcaceae bacterium HSG8]|nr:hypothetical protein [Desulfococcaceae bacterium HSG8]